jgi:hypothetical protein
MGASIRRNAPVDGREREATGETSSQLQAVPAAHKRSVKPVVAICRPDDISTRSFAVSGRLRSTRISRGAI